MDCSLIFPPLWYFPAVPGDLAVAAGVLRDAGLSFEAHDLSARLFQDLLGDVEGFQALTRLDTWRSPELLRAAWSETEWTLSFIGKEFGAALGFDELRLAGIDPASVRSCTEIALQGPLNPAIPTLAVAASSVLTSGARVCAVACVHPDQRPQAIAFASILRAADYQGTLVLFGSLEDQMSTAAFGADLTSGELHRLFLLFDAILVGEIEDTLPRVCAGDLTGPGVIVPGTRSPERTPAIRLKDAPLPDWSWVAEKYHTPAPIIDVRLGRGCPWARCAFCAIPSHLPGYRTGGVDRLVAAVTKAHSQTGSSWFRLRDDLLTPRQLADVGEAFAKLPFSPRWNARVRFSDGLTNSILATARAGGLEELWIGLESASERLRSEMGKGVSSATVERVMDAAEREGVWVRALTVVGYPGETQEDFELTLQWLDSNFHRLSGFSATPFRVTRGSPIAARLDETTFRIASDPLDARDRMRINVPTDCADFPVTLARMQRLIERFGSRIQALPCTDPTSLWIQASVARRAPG